MGNRNKIKNKQSAKNQNMATNIKNTKIEPTKGMLVFRMLMGVYFAYMAGKVYASGAVLKYSGVKQIMVIGCLVLFVACGVGLIVTSLKKLRK